MKKGFTILELIIVIVMIGVLVTVGWVQYMNALEKGRSAEARSNLGLLRQAEIAYSLEHGGQFAPFSVIKSGLPGGSDYACAYTTTDRTFYFQYFCNGGTGTCYALRCESGGKNPVGYPNGYYLSLSIAGNFSEERHTIGDGGDDTSGGCSGAP